MQTYKEQAIGCLYMVLATEDLWEDEKKDIRSAIKILEARLEK